MSSLLTNSSAMVALQTLQTINKDLETTQSRISTGLRVNDASDNAAYWSIATTMKSDNKAMDAVGDALGLGAATVDVAFTAVDQAVDVVDEIKSKLVAATEPGVDRGKIQEDISALQDQLVTIAESASFNGENWLSQDSTTANFNKEVVGGFTRDSDGNVTIQKIDIDTSGTTLIDTSGNGAGILDKDFSLDVAKDKATKALNATVAAKAEELGYGDLGEVSLDQAMTAIGGSLTAGDPGFELQETLKAAYTDAAGLEAAFDTADFNLEHDGTNWVASTTNAPAEMSVLTIDISGLTDSETDIAELEAITSALDGQIQAMTDAATTLGSAKSRIDMQSEFVGNLQDAVDRGVGQLVDADMNEESTRLQALQTQQQLGIQALSIANSQSQNILSLFR
ncbi:flagellin [Rhodobacteraceae bacterium RKSG542]|uniref:flagellin N-terminal helical domain-containing protein n=1 Tax=Pseudovibrio flavus TaxID=2529854 RepID=UPI0012BD068A|nr:flagellin [Pseudovibrio flavus]MTI16924.1 flagellin [Pseudovibrio flavus]